MKSALPRLLVSAYAGGRVCDPSRWCARAACFNTTVCAAQSYRALPKTVPRGNRSDRLRRKKWPCRPHERPEQRIGEQPPLLLVAPAQPPPFVPARSVRHQQQVPLADALARHTEPGSRLRIAHTRFVERTHETAVGIAPYRSLKDCTHASPGWTGWTGDGWCGSSCCSDTGSAPRLSNVHGFKTVAGSEGGSSADDGPQRKRPGTGCRPGLRSCATL